MHFVSAGCVHLLPQSRVLKSPPNRVELYAYGKRMEQKNTNQNESKISPTKYANIVYGLQATSFLIPFTFLIAVIINYVKQNDVRNTFVESHFRWQIRTFGGSLVWCLFGYATLIIGIFFWVGNQKPSSDFMNHFKYP